MVKKAILIGFSYHDTESKLNGTITDVKNMYSFLINKYLMKKEDITVFSDIKIKNINTKVLGNDKNNENNKSIIFNEFIRIVKILTNDQDENNEFWFYFSGHGTSWYYDNGNYKYNASDNREDESDNKDECLCTYDFFTRDNKQDVSNLIYDNELRYLVRMLPSNCSFYGLIDACNSGTIFDLPYRWTDEEIDFHKENNDENYNTDNIFIVSGCKDNQSSFDLGSQIGGLLTSKYLQILSTRENFGDINLLEFVQRLSNNVRIYNPHQYVTATSCIKLNPNMKLFNTCTKLKPEKKNNTGCLGFLSCLK